MNKVKVFLLVAIIYLAGIYTGVNMQDVNAVVRAPNEYNHPTASNGAKTQAVNQAPAARTNPNVVQMPPPQAAPQPEQQPAHQPVQAQQPAAYQPPAAIQPMQKMPANEPVSAPAAYDRGATLYSVSSSMLSDIERLEEDVALLKNKVNILVNMR